MTKDTLCRWLPFLQWPAFGPALWRSEILAGLTVALVLIPQSVAYAGLAGMPLITGLYAALLPALLAVLFSDSTRLSVGPTALTCLLVSTALTGLAEPGSAEWVNLAVWLAIFSGLLQLVLGLWGFGWLLNLVSSPVLAGFTQAAAILIMLSQLQSLLGLQGPLKSLWQDPSFNLEALAYGVGSLALLSLGKRHIPRFPMVVLVVAGSAVISQLTDFQASGGAVIGALPSGLPDFYWPTWEALPILGQLVVPAMVIALVSFLETASSAKVEHQRNGTRWNDNQDLVGQGLGKLASAFCGSFPSSASFSRSAVNLFAGARSGWATIAMVGFVLLALLALMPALYHVPKAVLGAVVIAAVTGLIKPSILRRLWTVSRPEAVICASTFALTLITAPTLYWGVLAGVLMALAHYLHDQLNPRIIEVGLHPDGSLRGRHLWDLPPLAPRLLALRMDSNFDFATASSFQRRVDEYLAKRPDTRHVCLFAHPINRMDATGVEVFELWRKSLNEQGITLHLSGLKLPLETLLQRAGELPENPMLRLYRSDADALTALARLEQEAIPAT
jgi:sulfate permease, SulP family